MAEVASPPAPTADSGPAPAAPADGGQASPAPTLSVAQQEFLERCKLSEHAERYDDMIQVVKSHVSAPGTGPELNVDERNLFSIAYKNVIGTKRSAWRIVKAIEDNVLGNNNTGGSTDIARKQEIAKEYRQKISGELCAVANEVIELLDTYLIPRTEDSEAKVFYLKMKADYHRYLAEVTADRVQAEATSNAHTAYAAAIELAKSQMTPTHPIRLGLVLNYSVFYYEILQNKEEAQALAREAFDSAISELDSLAEDSYKDSTMVLQLIRDNLTLWTNEQGAADTEDADESGTEDSTAGPATVLLEDGEAPLNIIEDGGAPAPACPAE